MPRNLTSQLLRKTVVPFPTAALRDTGLFLLRAAPALYLLKAHGWPKLGEAFGFLRGQDWDLVQLVRDMGFPAPAFFAICASLSESVGAALVACGLFTRLAAASVTFNMLVAVYADRLTGSSIENAFLYAIPFATLALTGPGTFSIDYLRGQEKGHHG